MRYIPHTPQERAAMLAALGLTREAELFSDIPEAARLHRPLQIPGPLSEMELQAEMSRWALENQDAGRLTLFLGGQFYDRFVPAAVGALAFRGEFATAYTPYQPELSQGTLAAIFEFQTMIASLTGMHAAQASMYDGSSAAGEAALLAVGVTGRDTIVLEEGVFPDSVGVVETYVSARKGKVLWAGRDGSLKDCLAQAGSRLAALIVQQPDLFGNVRDLRSLAQETHAQGALFIVAADPVALALVEPPGAMGADVAIGEGQPLGNHMQYGGPTLGFFAVTEALVRRLPGRLVGETHDTEGRRGFVLTLQAREQHIRRERATSNICSNHSLNALQSTIYMSLVGPEGLREVARLSSAYAHYATKRLLALPGVTRFLDNGPYLYEVALKMPGSVADLNAFLLARGIVGGYDMGQWNPRWAGGWQLAFTEKRTRAELDELVEGVTQWISR